MKKPTKDMKAVIFDLDETLINASKGLDAAQKAVSERIVGIFGEKLRLKKEEIREKLSDFDDEMNRQRFYDRDKWWPKFLKRLGIKVDPTESQIEELTGTYWDAYVREADPYPDVKPTLDYLKEKEMKLGIITDTDGSKIPKRNRIEPLDISDMFDATVIAGKDTPEPKPHPEGYRKLLSKLNTNVNNTVMVGDKPFTDIKGANSLGMVTVLVDRRSWNSEEKPDYTIKEIGELKALI